MPRLIVKKEDVNRRRLDTRAIKSPCCQAATQLQYETVTSNRHAFILICLKCDDLWVYYEEKE